MSAPGTGSNFDPLPRLWLCDFDYTLVELGAVVDWAASRRELEPMLRAAGCPEEMFVEFPHGNLLLYDAVRHRLQAEQFTPNIPPREVLRRASDIIEHFELAGVDRAHALPGAERLLTELFNRKLGVVVVTSNSSRTVVRWLARARLVHTVSTVVGRDTLMALKPDPAMVRRALDHCKVDAGEAIFVGDSDADFKAAAAGGVRFVAIASSPEREALMNQRGAANVFSSPAQLMEAMPKRDSE